MAFEGRIFLGWDEAAQVLGMDREGLRQAMLYAWSPTSSHPEDLWLPAMFTLPKNQFMTSLEFDSWNRTPDIQWSGRDSYYAACEGQSALNFSDGSSLPLRGNDGQDNWEAEHGDGCGWPHTFSVGGDTLVISPETVADACAADGYITVAKIAPRGWCDNGFSHDLCFVILNCANTIYERRPENIFDSAVFLRRDVMRMKSALSDTADEPTASADKSVGAWPWGDHDTALLRHLAAAADRFWKLYDPTDPTTAPTNATVSSWLVERDVASRVAECMAQILRADGLKTGPRR